MLLYARNISHFPNMFYLPDSPHSINTNTQMKPKTKKSKHIMMLNSSEKHKQKYVQLYKLPISYPDFVFNKMTPYSAWQHFQYNAHHKRLVISLKRKFQVHSHSCKSLSQLIKNMPNQSKQGCSNRILWMSSIHIRKNENKSIQNSYKFTKPSKTTGTP